MHKRTFELIAKWIGSETGIRIEFTKDGDKPAANVESKIIKIPLGIKNDHALAALATIMHEAGHIKWSKVIPQAEITGGDKINFLILNAIEDVRIDRNVMNEMYNIRSFYKHMVRRFVYPYAEEAKANLPFFVRALQAGILDNERFDGKKLLKPDEIAYYESIGLSWEMNSATWSIECGNWEELKKKIAEIRKKILPVDPRPPDSGGEKGGENGKEGEENGDKNNKGKEKQKSSGNGKGQSSGSNPEPDDDDDEGDGAIEDCNSQPQPQSNGSGQGDQPPDSVLDQEEKIPDSLDNLFHKEKIWEKAPLYEQMDGCETVAGLDIQDMTKNRLKEILNTKIKSLLFDGKKLNIDGLTNFFTGNIDELFIDDSVLNVKHSKMYFLLDMSGSMSSYLMDKQTRYSVVRKCMSTMQQILEEIIHIEGVDVDYDIYGFTCGLEKLDKKEWQKRYCGGGTSLLYCFTELMEKHIIPDTETDGKKIVTIITDGEVHAEEIREMSQKIKTMDSTVRAMIIGVGSDPGGQFVQRIIGDNNILAEQMSDEILMNVAINMLEG